MTARMSKHDVYSLTVRSVRRSPSPTSELDEAGLDALAERIDAVWRSEGPLEAAVTAVVGFLNDGLCRPEPQLPALAVVGHIASRAGVVLPSEVKPGSVPEWALFAYGGPDPDSIREGLLGVADWTSPAGSAASGLTAAVGCASSGHPGEEKAIANGYAKEAAIALQAMGFDVEPPAMHAEGVNCTVTRDVDLFVAAAHHPSTRLGHQLARVSALMTPIIVMSMVDTDLSCLFDDPTLGDFRELKFTSGSQIGTVLQRHVLGMVPELRAHARQRSRRDAVHRESFEELRDTLAAHPLQHAAGLPLPDRMRAIVTSVDTYAAAGLAEVNAMREALGLGQLGVAPTDVPVTRLLRPAASD